VTISTLSDRYQCAVLPLGVNTGRINSTNIKLKEYHSKTITKKIKL
jgi:hypothetical protein